MKLPCPKSIIKWFTKLCHLGLCLSNYVKAIYAGGLSNSRSAYQTEMLYKGVVREFHSFFFVAVIKDLL